MTRSGSWTPRCWSCCSQSEAALCSVPMCCLTPSWHGSSDHRPHAALSEELVLGGPCGFVALPAPVVTVTLLKPATLQGTPRQPGALVARRWQRPTQRRQRPRQLSRRRCGRAFNGRAAACCAWNICRDAWNEHRSQRPQLHALTCCKAAAASAGGIPVSHTRCAVALKALAHACTYDPHCAVLFPPPLPSHVFFQKASPLVPPACSPLPQDFLCVVCWFLCTHRSYPYDIGSTPAYTTVCWHHLQCAYSSP